MGRSLFDFCEKGPGLGDIPADLIPESHGVGETLLTPQMAEELQPDAAVIEVAVKVQKEGLHRDLRSGADGGAGADIGHAGEAAAIGQIDAGDISVYGTGDLKV